MESRGLQKWGLFFIPAEDYRTLRRAFSRDIFESHEHADKRRGCVSYWLDSQWCRQHHHPPAVILRTPHGEPKGPVVLLHIAPGVTTSGMHVTSILADQVRSEHPLAQHRLMAISASEHHTGGASGVDVMVTPRPLIHLIWSTGGTGHSQPFHLIIGSGEEMVRIRSWYTSMRGTVDQRDEIDYRVAGQFLTKPGYRAAIVGA